MESAQVEGILKELFPIDSFEVSRRCTTFSNGKQVLLFLALFILQLQDSFQRLFFPTRIYPGTLNNSPI